MVPVIIPVKEFAYLIVDIGTHVHSTIILVEMEGLMSTEEQVTMSLQRKSGNHMLNTIPCPANHVEMLNSWSQKISGSSLPEIGIKFTKPVVNLLSLIMLIFQLTVGTVTCEVYFKL